MRGGREGMWNGWDEMDDGDKSDHMSCHERRSLLCLCLSDRCELGEPIIVDGKVPLSIAAAKTSAGRSSCTPSEYANASRGEYAGGSRFGTSKLCPTPTPAPVPRPPSEASAGGGGVAAADCNDCK